MRNFRILLAVCLALSLASCGRLKHTTKIDESLSKAQSSTDIVETVKTTESVDTLVTLAADSAESVVHIVPNVDTTYLVLDNDRQAVEVTYDPIRQTIRTKAIVKPQLVPVRINKEVVEQRKISSDFKTVDKEKHVDEKVTKTNPLIPWYVWFIILLIIGGYLFFRYVIRIPPS